MDPAFAQELQTIIVSLQRAQIVNYVNVASIALVAYDFVITFSDEVRLMWGKKWNTSKIFFFATRYPVFIDGSLNLVLYLFPNLNANLCAPLYKASAWLSYFGIVTAEIILMMRTYAIYGRTRVIAVFLVVLNVGLNIPNIVLLQTSLKSLAFLSPSPFPTLAPCVTSSADRIVFVDFFLLMTSELVIVILTLWRGFHQWKDNSSPMMKTLVEDGFLYFLFLFAISLANAIVLIAAPLDYSGLLLMVQRGLHAMLSARVLLHIRDAFNDYPMSASNPPTLSWAAAPNNVKSMASDIRFASSQSGSDIIDMSNMQKRMSSGSRAEKASPSSPTVPRIMRDDIIV
ncbi:hypothetical protein BD410DRAFT_900545 [Rickenella mellea]|uniref:DUF6533 domain-containing protein n=1 Tax=Rickenella mellea TaxID=50990 RepID=A0A4Y7PUU7_9AGAM|nr:hypothetical protein BD410DRAFT_900545 [Rickenella mellea]